STVGMSINNADGAAGTTYSAYASYTLGAAYQYRFVALGVDLTANTAELDMNSYTGIEFYVKGDGHRLAVELASSANISPNFYAYDFTTTTDWIKVTVPFTSLSQPGFGPTVSLSEALRRMKALHFKASSQIAGESGSFRVDEVRFVTADFVAPNPVSGVSVNLISDAPLSWTLIWNNSTST
ncbi:MAG: CIA30 family protein, partial [Candidatus Margulisiibacteriota bacterium]